MPSSNRKRIAAMTTNDKLRCVVLDPNGIADGVVQMVNDIGLAAEPAIDIAVADALCAHMPSVLLADVEAGVDVPDFIVTFLAVTGGENLTVLVTATSSDARVEAALAAGAQGELIKPFTAEDLADKLRRLGVPLPE
jgi:AmiR/NasT family two-component response regulator